MSGAGGRRVLAIAAVMLCALGAGSALTSAARATGATGEVYVVHALPGATVDVVVDGREVGPDTAPEAVLGPLDLTAGAHDVELRDDSGAVVLASRITVEGGDSLDVVAHLAADTAKTPKITVFPNNVEPIGRGKVRLAVTHVAAAPPADIEVDGNRLFRNVANGESKWIDAPAKECVVEVLPTTGGDAIAGPVTLDLTKGTLTRVLAFGDPAAGTAGAMVHEIRIPVVGAGKPTSVDTGTGGQAAALFVTAGGPSMPASIAVALLGVVLLVVSRMGTRRAVVAGAGSRHAR